ncbi:uncharacterized protein LOC143275578 [Babylonia areolata]|uniref:uncharacterized protein LOC143275578 n=1 Tax=Babylonia areolata TaxID=304850 RepID=UPI003FD309FF
MMDHSSVLFFFVFIFGIAGRVTSYEVCKVHEDGTSTNCYAGTCCGDANYCCYGACVEDICLLYGHLVGIAFAGLIVLVFIVVVILYFTGNLCKLTQVNPV